MKIKALVVSALMMLSLFGFVATLPPQQASAAVSASCKNNFLGFPAWYEYLDVEPDSSGGCSIVGPENTEIGGVDWVKAAGFIGIAIVEILLRIAGLIAVVFVFVGGFRYITSQGEPENTKSARQTLQNAIIGLVISLIATGVVAFIGNTLS